MKDFFIEKLINVLHKGISGVIPIILHLMDWARVAFVERPHHLSVE